MARRVLLPFGALLLFAATALAQDLGCDAGCYIEDTKYNLALAAGDAYSDNNVYHQKHGDRPNAQWRMQPVPGEPGFFYICDVRWTRCLAAGEAHADGRIYHQPHGGRDNAKWKATQRPDGSYELTDKKYRLAIAAGEAYADNNVYHQAAGGRPNAAWRITPVGAVGPSVPWPSGEFVLRDEKHGYVMYVADNGSTPGEMATTPARHGKPFPSYLQGFGFARFRTAGSRLIVRVRDDFHGARYMALSAPVNNDGIAYFVDDTYKHNGLYGPWPELDWTRIANGCPSGSFRLMDMRHRLYVVAGNSYDSKVYYQRFDNRPNACWRAIPAGEYDRAENEKWLTANQRPGAAGSNGEGSGDLKQAASLPLVQGRYKARTDAYHAGSSCADGVSALLPTPCMKWYRRCLWAVNKSSAPVLMVSGKVADANQGWIVPSGWMIVPAGEFRRFQAITDNRWVTCAGCSGLTWDQVNRTTEYQVTPTAKLTSVEFWNAPGGGRVYVGTAWYDDSNCPNPLNLE